MQRKSVGAAVPTLPLDAQERLGLIETPHDVALDDDYVDPNYDPNVGPPGVVTWLPPGEERPGVLFAVVETIFDQAWLLRGELIPDERAGLLRVARLTIEPCGHEREVSGAVVRKLRPAEIRDRVIAKIEALASRPIYSRGTDPEDWEPDFSWDTPAYHAHVEVQTAPRHKGRRGHPDEHYRDVALAYLGLYTGGVGRGILQALAEPYEVPWQTARDWVARARELEYLTPGKAGRAGAAPGPRLIAEMRALGRSIGRA
jgi:hypothetical protein